MDPLPPPLALVLLLLLFAGWVNRHQQAVIDYLLEEMPYRDIETILKIFFPMTRLQPTGKGFYKRVYVIHSHRRRLVLKIGRSKRHIRKDYTTYTRLAGECSKPLLREDLLG